LRADALTPALSHRERVKTPGFVIYG